MLDRPNIGVPQIPPGEPSRITRGLVIYGFIVVLLAVASSLFYQFGGEPLTRM